MKLLLSILFPIFVFAAPKLRSANALKTQLKDNTFIAELAMGHHFNDKAPNGLQVGEQLVSPSVFEKQKITISSLPAQYKTGTAYLYVCDDAVTYCEVHAIEMDSEKSKSITKTKTQKRNKSHGFILNDFDGALQEAQKKNKLLLVDVGARWCPACLRLEGEIFTSKQFNQQTKDFVMVKLDGDVFANAPMLEKYSVKGFPTVLFLTSKGEEIIRFMDYQPMDLVAEFI